MLAPTNHWHFCDKIGISELIELTDSHPLSIANELWVFNQIIQCKLLDLIPFCWLEIVFQRCCPMNNEHQTSSSTKKNALTFLFNKLLTVFIFYCMCVVPSTFRKGGVCWLHKVNDSSSGKKCRLLDNINLTTLTILWRKSQWFLPKFITVVGIGKRPKGHICIHNVYRVVDRVI